MIDISICPRCGSYNQTVSDSRKRGSMITRSRKCLDCGHRIHTVEITREEYDSYQREDTRDTSSTERLIKELRAICDKYEAEESEKEYAWDV